MEIAALLGVFLISALICAIVRENSALTYAIVGTGVTVAAFAFFVYRTSDTVKYCISVAEDTSFGKYSGYILKALGISCLTSFVAGVCRDLDSEKAAQRAGAYRKSRAYRAQPAAYRRAYRALHEAYLKRKCEGLKRMFI